MAVRDKTQNLRRLEAQRNELNHKGASHPPAQIRSDPFDRNVAASRPSAGPAGRCTVVQRVGEFHARARAWPTDPRLDPPAPSPA